MSSGSGISQNVFENTSGLPNTPNKNLVVTLTTATAYTVSPGQSNVLFQLPSVGATISLPAAANSAGATYTFVLTANNATTAWTIASTTTNVYGRGVHGATATTPYPLAAGSTNIVLGTGTLKGDLVTIVSDGTNYYVTAFSGYNLASTNGISFS
jgi:hypothetical protein